MQSVSPLKVRKVVDHCIHKWKASAKYYSLTRTGRKQLAEEAESWGRMSAMINRVLRTN